MTTCVRASQRRRRALTLTTAAAALIGAPLLGGSAASADSAGNVTFTGDCGLLGLAGGGLHADAEEVSIPAGSGLRFTNGLDKDATLALDGQPAAQVPAGGSADVVFNNGPVQATMQVQCTLGESAGTVTVEVVPARDKPDEKPSGGTGSSPSPSSSSSPTPAGPSGGQQSPVPGPGAQPGGEASGGWWAAGPGGPGVPAGPGGPGGAPEAEPGDESRDETGRDRERRSRWELTDPANGGGTSPDPATVDAQAEDQLAADQVTRTAGSGPDDGPIGLLALVATVCVVGVSAGAVRALVSRRLTSA